MPVSEGDYCLYPNPFDIINIIWNNLINNIFVPKPLITSTSWNPIISSWGSEQCQMKLNSQLNIIQYPDATESIVQPRCKNLNIALSQSLQKSFIQHLWWKRYILPFIAQQQTWTQFEKSTRIINPTSKWQTTKSSFNKQSIQIWKCHILIPESNRTK